MIWMNERVEKWLIVLAVIILVGMVGYGIVHGTMQANWSFEKKCNEMYGNGTWLKVSSALRWTNNGGEYADEMDWEICIPAKEVREELERWERKNEC